MAFVPGEVVAAADPRIVLEGQWGQQPGIATTVNSGSRISFTFNGERVQLLFDVAGLTIPPHLWISVDEGEPELHLVDTAVIELTAERGQHKVEIVVKDVNEHANRWNPPFGCAVVFAGLVLDQDTRLRLSGRPGGPRLEFYGDSITQGVRALSTHSESEGADGSKSYAYLTARALRASAYQVGFGSQGIVKPGNGEVPSGLESFGWNFSRLARRADRAARRGGAEPRGERPDADGRAVRGIPGAGARGVRGQQDRCLEPVQWEARGRDRGGGEGVRRRPDPVRRDRGLDHRGRLHRPGAPVGRRPRQDRHPVGRRTQSRPVVAVDAR